MNEMKQAGARFELDMKDLMYLGAMRIAGGDWELLGNSEDKARDILMTMMTMLKSHGPEAIRNIVWLMQTKLMAQRRSDFSTTQLEAPFWPCVRNHLEILDEWWAEGGKAGFLEIWDMVFRPGWKEEVVPHEIIRLTGGPGDSEDTAFRVHAPDAEIGVCAEYWHLFYTYGRMHKDWIQDGKPRVVPGKLGGQFEVYDITFPDGEQKRVYFAREPQASVSSTGKPKSTFTNEELVPITATYIASGEWDPLTEAEGKEYLLEFIQKSKASGLNYVRSVFRAAQEISMAVGENSFTEKQKLPPFSQFGFMNMVALQDAWLKSGDEGFEAEWQRIFAPGWQAEVIPNRSVTLTGGPGDCEDTAFRVHAPDVETRIGAEYWHLCYTYGRRDVDWKRSDQYFTPRDELGREFDVIEVELPNGEIRPTFFLRQPQYKYV